MKNPRKYDSTVARIAGNILSGVRLGEVAAMPEWHVNQAVRLARMIVAEVASTEPADVEPQS